MKHSKGRITSLSDGVFAFAATLMVVDLGTTIDFNHLDAQLSSFVGFGIAFFCNDAALEITLQLFSTYKICR